jgi:nitrate reductase alpha subunit
MKPAATSESGPADATHESPESRAGAEREAGLSRRRFLVLASAAGFGALVTSANLFGAFRQIAVSVPNPLEHYPNRDWERIYRDLFHTDGSFVFLCAPNDTHNCLLRAYVKNDVVVRIEPSYGYARATDLSGTRASPRWDPRCCQKGLVLMRRLYGDRRVKGAFLRKGFKEWVESGFPRDPETGRPPESLFQRGWDGWVRLSHEEAYVYHARALENISRTYSGEQGRRYLAAQGYDEDMIAALEGAGTRTLKFRGGMALLGVVRIFGMFRFANGVALLDHHIRGVQPSEAKGGGAWDSYSFHTDLPPGHPMVCGEQTNDFELHDAENAKLIIAWGMNWITTKMPDAHWLTEARLKGAHTVAVTVEYSATASKCDEVIVIRPGTDPAFALGVAQVMVSEKLYDEAFVKNYTDLPSLIRMDTLERLRAADVFPDHRESTLANWTRILAPGAAPPPAPQQDATYVPSDLRADIADFVVWDVRSNSPKAVSRDQVGELSSHMGLDPALSGAFALTTVDGKKIEVRPVFELTRQYLDENLTPEKCQQITWAPEEAIRSLARQIAAARGQTLIACGMGPNQFFNNDNKDRAIWLVQALTGNVGRHGGNIGSYAGNYKTTVLAGIPLFATEDPFDLQLDPSGPVHTKSRMRSESLHYWAGGERLVAAGKKKITTGAHVPTPTKGIWQVNSNSSLGNQKGHYDVVNNTLPRCELVAYNDWWWTASCEYSDVVYGVDSWLELRYPDLTASNSNPFLQVFPVSDIPRVFETVSDNDTYLGVARQLARLTGDGRFVDQWKFIAEGRAEVYLQRILDGSPMARGYRFEDLHRLAKEGTPVLSNARTYPRINSYEQVHESKPWTTRTGRLEFYRPEVEFIEAGENLVVHREPSDSTFYEPCSILAAPHPALRPKTPADWGIAPGDRSQITRQMRNTMYTADELVRTHHPLHGQGFRHVFHTPKYRHGAHTTPVDTDLMMTLFGPFGDMYRRDIRMPGTGEMYVDMHPNDARALGIEDGDYIWIDGDPTDLPFRGWNDGKHKKEYHVARLMARARFYPGTPPGITRMWFNGYMATPGSVHAHETRPDKLAKNAETQYQAMFRYGGHQSLTRTWLKPTHQTHGLVHRKLYGGVLAKGFAADVHCVTGAPREALARFQKAENGGIGGHGRWRPVELGLRPANESPALLRYLSGEFLRIVG